MTVRVPNFTIQVGHFLIDLIGVYIRSMVIPDRRSVYISILKHGILPGTKNAEL